MNSGVLVLSSTPSVGAGIFKGQALTNSTLNLNGGTIKAGITGLNLVSAANGLQGNIYNGGAVIDVAGYPSSIDANLIATTGYGAYAASGSGVIATTSSGGGGYIGNPLVIVSGGSGTGQRRLLT